MADHALSCFFAQQGKEEDDDDDDDDVLDIWVILKTYVSLALHPKKV